MKFGDDRLPKRFWDKVTVDTDTGCWLWTGANAGEKPYGVTWDGERRVKAHRFAYEALAGPITPGLQIDHLCLVKSCVNPEHLEPVTPGENIRRGGQGQITTAIKRARTHCPKGHPYAGDNLYMHPTKGYRACRACRREGMRLK